MCTELHVHEAMLVIATVESLLTYIHYTHAVKVCLLLHWHVMFHINCSASSAEIWESHSNVAEDTSLL